MTIWSVGNEFTGESSFHRTRRDAMRCAREQADHSGWMCYVGKHEVKRGIAGLIRFLNYLPVERISGEISVSPKHKAEP